MQNDHKSYDEGFNEGKRQTTLLYSNLYNKYNKAIEFINMIAIPNTSDEFIAKLQDGYSGLDNRQRYRNSKAGDYAVLARNLLKELNQQEPADE